MQVPVAWLPRMDSESVIISSHPSVNNEYPCVSWMVPSRQKAEGVISRERESWMQSKVKMF